jgi:hypothetical protein
VDCNYSCMYACHMHNRVGSATTHQCEKFAPQQLAGEGDRRLGCLGRVLCHGPGADGSLQLVEEQPWRQVAELKVGREGGRAGWVESRRVGVGFLERRRQPDSSERAGQGRPWLLSAYKSRTSRARQSCTPMAVATTVGTARRSWDVVVTWRWTDTHPSGAVLPPHRLE